MKSPGKHARRKGAGGEREVAKILSDHLGLKLVRNAQQTARGGRDLCEDIDQKQSVIPFAIEVKRQERPNLGSWWQQTLQQAQEVQRIPVLWFRSNRQPWRVATDPHYISRLCWWEPTGRYVIMDELTGLEWMREELVSMPSEKTTIPR